MPDVGKNGELPEFPVAGPFGGIQSEMPSEQIIGVGGFADALNVMFRQGRARVRPRFGPGIPDSPLVVRIKDLGGTIAQQAWTPDGRPYFDVLDIIVTRIEDLVGTITEQDWIPGSQGFLTKGLETTGAVGYIKGGLFVPIIGVEEAWTGITNFFSVDGQEIQVGTTSTQFYYYTAGGWSRLFGAMSPGVPSFAEVGQKLCFSQGIDPVAYWDGSTTSITPILGAPIARYLFEYGTHLIALNTIEGGGHSYQRIHWSGAGDPTDWTSFDSGQVDLDNDLGPINGGLKLGYYGFIFQQKGIVQMQLTGNALQPFTLIPVSSASKGLAIPRSLAANGETTCYYVGQDNVYVFDGSGSNPVGDMPMQGRLRMGARSRIFADIMLADHNDIFGFVSMAVNGNPYNAYWLVVPNVAIWVFNIDDATWTRWTISGKATCVGPFLNKGVVRIQDLIGTIEQQQWTPATQVTDNPFTSVMVGEEDGTSLLFDFSGWSEQPWLLKTGELDYGDGRHESTTKKIRLSYKDHGPCNIHILFINQDDEASLDAPTSDDTGLLVPGNNNGRARKIVFPVNLSGIYVTMELYGDPGTPFEMSSYAPCYSPAGEVRNAL